MFASKPAKKIGGETTATDGAPEKPKKGTELKVLDGKTAQNLSIFVGSFKIPYETIKKKILEVDEEVIDGNALENLVKKLPGKEQIDMLKEFKNEYEDLNEAEKFVFTLSDVSRLEQRLGCMQAKLDFNEVMVNVKPDISNATEACKEILKSKRWASFLELLLLTGNFMNAGTRNSQAHGFDLNLLSKVGGTKSVDGKVTLTHFLADMVSEKYPEIEGFTNDLSHLQEASRVSDDQTLKSVLALEAGLTKIRNELKFHDMPSCDGDNFGERMREFVAERGEAMQIVKEMHKNMTALFNELIEFYCLDPKKTNMEDLFGLIFNFVTEYNNCQKENQKRKEKEEKDRKAKERQETDRRKKEAKEGKNKTQNIIDSAGDEGVLDGLMAALETGSAFRDPSRPQRRRQPRKNRNAPDMLQRKGTRVNMVPIKMLSPGEKLTEKLGSPS